jgi:hypothetical protein
VKYTRTKTYEVMSDGYTVWVNSNLGGYALGRFSRTGIDIHKDSMECLDCMAGPTTHEHWERFKAGMKRYHGIDVPEKHMPKFLIGESS